MYLYDSLPSGAHRGTAISLGELGRATKRAPVQDSTKAPYRWIFARDLFFPYICYCPAVNTVSGVLTERVSSGGKICISMIAH